MGDHKRAADLAKEGFDLWTAGQLSEAEEKYRLALPDLDPERWWTPSFHGEFAALLSGLDKRADAEVHYRRALELELQQEPTGSSSVYIARYFLGEHFLRCDRPEDALDAVAPSIERAERIEALLRLVQAEALQRLGRQADAQEAGRRAISGCRSEKQLARIQARLNELFGAKP